MTNVTNFALAIYFGENTEYVGFRNETSSLLENAIWYSTEEEAKEVLPSVIAFGKAQGWDVGYGIYKFEA